MDNADKTILVTGATGKQGGAAARHLLRQGWTVRALVRDLSGAAAEILWELGAELVCGDMEDRASLDLAMQGAYGAFSIQPAGIDGTAFTVADEIRLGANVADAAKAAGVAHFVYASVGGPHAAPPLFQAKRAIERHIHDVGLPATILQPVSFMENCLIPQHHFQGLRDGMLATPIAPDATVQYISASDIGAFVALAFGRPGEYVGQSLEIAGDALTPPQFADAINRATGRPAHYVHTPITDSPQFGPAHSRCVLYIEWLNTEGYTADIPGLRHRLPELMDFETWLEKEGRAKLNAVSVRENRACAVR